MARSAPIHPAMDEHRYLAFQHFLLKVVVRQCDVCLIDWHSRIRFRPSQHAADVFSYSRITYGALPFVTSV